MTTDPALSREDIHRLLTEVGAYLHVRRWTATVYVAGGAAMSLLFDGRTTTRDIDAVFRSDRGQLEAAVRDVAVRHGLPVDWLSDRVTRHVPDADDTSATELVVPGLHVLVSSERHLLAMKMLAGRERDVPDLALLFARLGITTPAQAVAITDEVFGDTYPVERPPVEYLEALAADVLDEG
ncbi:hypothetical protein [Cellulomonas shaoxiangyii]|uniref:Nucleotidyl transferase n=1 Tax=Cellulomonas shaoxiangyii TaxID=2566013 RepID=A0A4P7SMI0_9CELL|nr:hypothetical protein [Cellulomonas shaoxiangyii]QCB94777.1 hypothetical protein E5225_15645 [Cellulomonas shaoxiangyii]TGY86507.1 hypothetical protein E5226_01670 [Cellulomonas shaoxiangyii]